VVLAEEYEGMFCMGLDVEGNEECFEWTCCGEPAWEEGCEEGSSHEHERWKVTSAYISNN
jgi:hypothetical protein